MSAMTSVSIYMFSCMFSYMFSFPIISERLGEDMRSQMLVGGRARSGASDWSYLSHMDVGIMCDDGKMDTDPPARCLPMCAIESCPNKVYCDSDLWEGMHALRR